MISLARIPDCFSQHGVKLALGDSFGCCTTVFRDTIFSTGREQAANSAGLRFGTGLILGFAVGGLWPRFRSKRVSLAQTALRLYPRRRAIFAALRPAAQSPLSSARSSASQPIAHAIRRLPTVG
jgi:hypothetical protein